MIALESGKKRKFDCPGCGRKRTFTRYVDEGGKYIAPDVGRCDRESNCGYHFTPKEHFAANPNQRPALTLRKKAKPQPQVRKPFDVIPESFLTDSLQGANPFVQFLLSRFDRNDVQRVADLYRVGAVDGMTVYWQIDQQGRVRTGKMIRHDTHKGKRIKGGGYNTDWMHAKLKRDGVLSEDFNLDQCFFGSHLLTDEVKTIAIVEAEKTAVIASVCLPEYTWIACGGKSILKAERLRRFAHCRVVLFPDADGFAQWSNEAKQARRFGLNIACSDLLEKLLTPDEKAAGFDLADFLLRPAEAIPCPSFDQLHRDAGEEGQYLLDERAAIFQYEGGLSRSEAEARTAQSFTVVFHKGE